MRRAKVSELYTVRNLQGQALATYFAFTAEQAINRLIADQAATASTFRKSQPMANGMHPSQLRAAVERKAP